MISKTQERKGKKREKKLTFGSSLPEVFYKKGVQKNFAKKIHKKTPVPECLFLIKLPATLLKMRLWQRCFSVTLARFLRTPVFKEHLWWLLLYLK